MNESDRFFNELLRFNPDVNILSNYGWSPLMLAVNRGFEDGVNALVNRGANTRAKNMNGWTALHFTVNNNRGFVNDYPAIAEILIRNRAAVDAKNHLGYTPLSLAVLNGSSKTLAILLKHNADVNARNHTGWTPIMFAVIKSNQIAFNSLLNYGVDLNMTNRQGCSALRLAQLTGQHYFVDALLNLGAKEQGFPMDCDYQVHDLMLAHR
jgi:ankyrin repeat protein